MGLVGFPPGFYTDHRLRLLLDPPRLAVAKSMELVTVVCASLFSLDDACNMRGIPEATLVSPEDLDRKKKKSMSKSNWVRERRRAYGSRNRMKSASVDR